ncbi:histone H1-like isoform X1 [Seriola lalandi dorsalis]|uniref:histone H1-like isoform X1 n=1 Tax=Seriola lalandi dorsalis TaxID=1841481 RepID=UPI000C6F4D49|nr:histone H1-like isoform X1 [Seriola lalandi dorsalis]
MAEVAPAAARAKADKRRAPRPKKDGPTLGELVVKAVAASRERSGVSSAALKKSLVAIGYDVDKNKARVRTVIRGLVAKGTLVQIRGTGACGSYKINKNAETNAKMSAPVAAKKPAAKTSPKKVNKPEPTKKAAKSPKKVHVGGVNYIHLSVFQALPCDGGQVVLRGVQEHKTEDDPLVPF